MAIFVWNKQLKYEVLLFFHAGPNMFFFQKYSLIPTNIQSANFFSMFASMAILCNIVFVKDGTVIVIFKLEKIFTNRGDGRVLANKRNSLTLKSAFP